MNDDEPGDPSPGDAATTDQPDVSSEALTQLGAAIESYRDQIGEAEADALEALREERDLDTERDLYLAAGFSGERYSLRVDCYEAELFTLLGLLDDLTQQNQHAEQFVPLARLIDEFLAEAPTPALATYAADRLDVPVEDLLAGEPTNDDEEGAGA